MSMRSFLIAFALLLLALPVLAQSHTKRLILKDGSYQEMTEYKLDGDRVHFYSAERFDWEDIPSSLIDWDATNKYNANPVKNDRSNEEREAADAEAVENAKSETEAPTVASHLRLPSSEIGGVYLLDKFKGAPELVEIVQSGADVNKNTGRNVLRATINPLGAQHQTVELPGAHARVQSHVTQPTIYLCVTRDKPVDVSNLYRIVRVDSNPQKNTRAVGTLKVKLSGKTTESEKIVPATVIKVNQGAWISVTPNQPLAPGEYAVIEMLGENEMNMYVWDFGVNPNAPENLNPLKPGVLLQ